MNRFEYASSPPFPDEFPVLIARACMDPTFAGGAMVKTFEDQAFAAEPGTLVAPFFTTNGWHVMLVND